MAIQSRQSAAVSVSEAHRRQAGGCVIVDVREADELEGGSPKGSLWCRKSFLEVELPKKIVNRETSLLLICQSGVRSKFAALSLEQLGYTNVQSVEGGFAAWKNAGLPVESLAQLHPSERDRYARQILLSELGEAGQRRLLLAKVLVVGVGGLGGPVSLYLAGAGVGELALIDSDRVELSNLHRQILFANDEVGQAKVEVAARRLLASYPHLKVTTHALRLNEAFARELLSKYDIVIDCTDNFVTRRLLNRVAAEAGKPLVHGSVLRFEGHVSVFWPKAGTDTPCYECAYPETPDGLLAPSCTEAGVIGVLPGIIGMLQAWEAIKLVTNIGVPLIGKTLAFDGLTSKASLYQQYKDESCPVCGTGQRSVEGHIQPLSGRACAL